LTIADGAGNNAITLRYKTGVYTDEQFIRAKLQADVIVDGQSHGVGICVRATDKDDLGYYVSLTDTASSANPRFVIGKGAIDATPLTISTSDYAVATDYIVELAVHTPQGGSDAQITARIYNGTTGDFLEEITALDTTTVIESGFIGMFSGAVSAGHAVVTGTFDDFEEFYGHGAYFHITDPTTDIVRFIPGRTPGTGDVLKAYYYLPFTGAWDSKQSLIIIAMLNREVETNFDLSVSPEIDDFLQIARVSEV
jgi:hypothetical protein